MGVLICECNVFVRGIARQVPVDVIIFLYEVDVVLIRPDKTKKRDRKRKTKQGVIRLTTECTRNDAGRIQIMRSEQQQQQKKNSRLHLRVKQLSSWMGNGINVELIWCIIGLMLGEVD